MTILSVSKLGLSGVNTDLEACDLPPETFTFGQNYRLTNKIIESFNGSTLLWTATSSINAAHVFFVKDGSNQFYVIAGRNKVLVYNGTVWTDITSTDLAANPMTADQEYFWTSCKLGKIPIINNPNHYPEYWDPQQTSQIFQPLKFDAANTWKQKGYHAKVMRSHKEFLFALNLSEGANNYPTAYRWSHPADINGLPPSWDETDLAYIASKEQIGGASGEIIDGMSLRDAFCIYSEQAINILDYTGGEFVFSRRELTSNFGLLAPNCVVEINGIHYFLTDGDILSNDGNSVQSILHNTLRKRIISSLSTDYYKRCFAIKNNYKKEVWFCLVEEGSQLPSLAIVYNWADNSISQRELNGTFAHMTVGPTITTNEIYSSTQLTYENVGTLTYDYNASSPFTNTFIGVKTSTSALYDIEDNISITSQTITIPTYATVTETYDDLGTLTDYDSIYTNTVFAEDIPYNTVLERDSFSIGNQVDVKTIIRVYPHIKCEGSVYIQIGAQDYLGAPVRWKPAVRFNPTTQRKVDVRSTGKLHSWRISSIGTDKFILSGFDIEYVWNGRR